MLERATITVIALGEPYTIRREGSQFYVQDSPARILSVEPEQNTVRLAYEAEDIDRTLLENMPITGEQFYSLLYGDQTPDLARFGRLEAQLEMLTQSQAPAITPAITEAALAKYSRAHMHSSLTRGVKLDEGHKAWLEFVPGCTKMLHELPVSITITRHETRYVWQFLQGNGSAETFIAAMRKALTYLEAASMRSNEQ